MTRGEILINSVWTLGKLNVYSHFFKKEVPIDLYTSDYNLKNTEKIISEKFVQQVNDFLNLSEQSKPLMQKLLYKHCVESCENISYGFDILDGETEIEASMREFGIENELTAFEKANLGHISIEEDELRKNRFVTIVFYPAWEAEHGCALILKNGDLLDFYGECGIYLGQFDD